MTTETATHGEPASQAPAHSGAPGFHVVQVGYDDSVFGSGPRSDFMERQGSCGRILEELVPGSRITNLILTRNAGAGEVRSGNVRYVPVPWRRRHQLTFRVRDALLLIHSQDPITLITTRTVHEDGIGALFFRRLFRVPVVGQIHYDIFMPAEQNENFGSAPWRWLLKAAVFRLLPRYDALRVSGEGVKRKLLDGRFHAKVHLSPEAMALPDPPAEMRSGEARAHADALHPSDRRAREWMGILVSGGMGSKPQPEGHVKARRPTWRRWKSLSATGFSLLRGLQYEAIRGLRLEGATLDVGGGDRNTYYGLLEFAGTVENINIDPGIKPTYLFDLNKPLPLASGTYDNVLSLNTWEHIYRDELAVKESLRVLKPGGRFYFSIPFMYKAHGSPNDYHRHTASWWRDYLVSLGVHPRNLKVEPLVWDPLSSALSMVDFLDRGWLRKLVMLLPLLSRKHGRLERVPHNRFDDFALGFYITGIK